MAVLSSSYPTLIDMAKSLDPSGRLARFANLLSQTNEMLTMLPAVKANNKTHHRVTQVTELPTTSTRSYNSGTTASKETKAQHDEGIALFDQWAVCDAALAGLSGNPGEYRAGRVRLGAESMSQKVQEVAIYGNAATDDAEFTGLFPRYNALTGSIGQQVVDCDGDSADVQTSMYLIEASPEKVYWIYPDGSQAGLRHVDHGMVVSQNTNGTTGANMASYMDQLCWDVGLAIEDQRCVVRLANIEVGHFDALTTTQAPTTFGNLLHKMMIAVDRLPRGGGGDKFFIANRTVRTGLTRLAMEKSTNALAITEASTVLGKSTSVLKFLDIPVLLVDQIINTEAVEV